MDTATTKPSTTPITEPQYVPLTTSLLPYTTLGRHQLNTNESTDLEYKRQAKLLALSSAVDSYSLIGRDKVNSKGVMELADSYFDWLLKVNDM